MTEPNITVELTAHEARALRAMAVLWSEVFIDHGAEPPEGCRVMPLDSAAMKLELQLRLEGVAI